MNGLTNEEYKIRCIYFKGIGTPEKTIPLRIWKHVYCLKTDCYNDTIACSECPGNAND